MGAYLSEPVTDKISTNGKDDCLRYGASSMQGWRVSQEDAHNCCVDFDPENNTKLFAVYDGHGGAEVAQYCSIHFPDFIKNLEEYRNGHLPRALEEAFLAFDAKLTEPGVIQELKELAGLAKEETSECELEEEKETSLLYEEATMPIDELMKRYGGRPADLRTPSTFLSPAIRSKDSSATKTECKTDDKKCLQHIPIMKLDGQVLNGFSEDANESENGDKSKISSESQKVPITEEIKSGKNVGNVLSKDFDEIAKSDIEICYTRSVMSTKNDKSFKIPSPIKKNNLAAGDSRLIKSAVDDIVLTTDASGDSEKIPVVEHNGSTPILARKIEPVSINDKTSPTSLPPTNEGDNQQGAAKSDKNQSENCSSTSDQISIANSSTVCPEVSNVVAQKESIDCDIRAEVGPNSSSETQVNCQSSSEAGVSTTSNINNAGSDKAEAMSSTVELSSNVPIDVTRESDSTSNGVSVSSTASLSVSGLSEPTSTVAGVDDTTSSGSGVSNSKSGIASTSDSTSSVMGMSDSTSGIDGISDSKPGVPGLGKPTSSSVSGYEPTSSGAGPSSSEPTSSGVNVNDGPSGGVSSTTSTGSSAGSSSSTFCDRPGSTTSSGGSAGGSSSAYYDQPGSTVNEVDSSSGNSKVFSTPRIDQEEDSDSEDSDELDSSEEEMHLEPDSEDSDVEEDGHIVLEGDDDEEEEEEASESVLQQDEPGSDSGCTAVLVLLRGRELHVANAGDSRCVVSRGGKAVDMSIDHKPEDEEERRRIEAAGGKVTLDGRVNGGLNLSRAIGDHCYKMNTAIPAKDQMISALPDVCSITLDEKDEFMVIACDGIWNYMTSQEVVDFVRIKLEDSSEKLSQICEEMFDHCLAPNTMGDGTGCDNMTCIIVTFNSQQLVTQSECKRKADDIDNADCKKLKTEET